MNMAIQLLIDRDEPVAGQRFQSLPASLPTAYDGNNDVVLATLMYVSTSRLDPATASRAVGLIVAHARLRNAAADITGALLFTGQHFVQVIEGEPAAIDALMVKLHADERHEKLMVLRRAQVTERQFGDWDLAYSGAAHFFRRRVVPLLDESDPAGQDRAALALNEIMYRFTKS